MGKPVIVLEGLNFIFKESELRKITVLHHDDVCINDIAKIVKRDEYEILLALMHQHLLGKLFKPIRIRRQSNE